MMMQPLHLWLLLLTATLGFNDDLFNYGESDLDNRNYGPEDWDQVTCDDVTTCTGWPDGWETAQGWALEENSCRHCPHGGNTCGPHHQSPIPLRRGIARPGRVDTNICDDQHWMKYEDGTCTWEHLTESFSIQRHALRLDQPIEFGQGGDEGFRLDCPGPNGAPRRFARIDFSWGFNFWWFLSHIDLKIPSEHTQNRKRYSAEIQMSHFFSAGPDERINDNELATLAIFLEADEEYAPYPHLDRMICQWRRAEQKTRAECNLDKNDIPPYPGCFDDHFDEEQQQPATGRRQRRGTMQQELREHQQKREHVKLEDVNYRPADQTEEEFAAFIDDYSNGRNLMTDEGSHLHFHNYQFLIDCKTEYYFRYHGTMTIPPCYGPAPPNVEATHEDTNHWRVMKDPVRIAQRQLEELERLLKDRVAPPNDVHSPCERDTAGAIDEEGQFSVARPLQSFNRQHDAVFCWCPMWPSKWPEDRAWCDLKKTNEERYMMFQHPYNYRDGFGF